jgi:hypothetical protein
MIHRVGRSLIPARAPHTVTREVDGGFVVLDRGRAHSVEAEAAVVWAAAGTTADVDPAALAELTDLGLLDTPGVSRRTLLRRSGVVAAGVAGVGIASMVLPDAASAASLVAGITLTPGTGPKGTTVTITGTNYPAGQLVVFTFNGGAFPTTTPTSVTTDGSGGFSATFVIPSTATTGAGSPNTVSAVAGGKSASANFIVPVPTLTLSPTSTPLGTAQTVTLTGSGYKGPSAMTVQVDGSTVTVTAPTPNITATGNIGTSTTITIPNTTTVGVHTVTVTDASGNVGTATFKVQPTITSPTVASPINPGHNGTGTFTITGTGFEVGVSVVGNGSVTVNSFTRNSSTSITVNVTGSGGNGANGSFTVTNPDGTSVTSPNGSFSNG